MLPHSLYSEITGMTVGKGIFPGVKFFNPSQKFLDWFKQEHPDLDTVIYDVGAGVGQVSKALADSGYKPIALDIHHRDEPEYPIQMEDGTAYEYEAGSVVLICRPCHNQFTRYTIAQALHCHVARILYVGLAKNLDADLGSSIKDFKLELNMAGDDREKVWVHRRWTQ